MYPRRRESIFGMLAMVESTKLEANIMLMDTMKLQRQCISSMAAIGMDAIAVSNPKRNIQKKERPCLTCTKRPKQ
jgi:hypothetical protein